MKKFFTFISLCMIAFNAIHAEITWDWDYDGTLTISGNDMPDYNDSSNTPWHSIQDKIEKVEIKNGVTNIGSCAFSGCSALISITIPTSVTSIGDGAFYKCSGLTSITIPNSVTKIGYGAFKYCSNLTSINIPSSVTSIGGHAFYGCSGLISLNISSSVTSIGSEAFYDTRWYNNQPNGLVYAGKVLCEYKGTMPANTKIVIKDGTKSIASSAFSECSDITSITIPNSVTSIGDKAFYKCSGLNSITIPNSVTSIGGGAFEGCSNLTSVTIPNSVTSIGGGALNGTNWYNNQPDGLVYAGLVLYKYKGTMPANTEIVIKDGTKSIAGRAFSECSDITSITIPNSVTSIGDKAFYKCSGLNSVTIPNSVTNIGDFAFEWCKGLTSITLSNSIKSIGRQAFNMCSSLTSITIPNSVTSIGDCAFYGCSGLTSISIPNTITSIGYSAFESCSGLTSITISNSVKSIKPYAFAYCSGLTSITIPNSVTSIGDYAFAHSSGLTSVTIGNSVKSIGEYVFSGCTSLTSIFCEATTPPQCDRFCLYNISNSILIYVPTNSTDQYKRAYEWGKFKILPIQINPTLTLTDKNSDLTRGYYKNGQITLSRNNMSVGDYATFCLPFDIDLSKTTDVFSKVYVPSNIGLLKPSGTLLLLLDEVNNKTIIKAGQIFVAKCQKSEVVFENCADVSFGESTPNPSPLNLKVYNFDDISGAYTQNTDVKIKIGGTYSQLSNIDKNNYRALYANGSFGSTTSVTPFQMYVYIVGNSSLSSKITSISFDFNNEATGIKELRTTNDNSPIYDLNGRMVNEKNLKPGLYIKNGKKIIIN